MSQVAAFNAVAAWDLVEVPADEVNAMDALGSAPPWAVHEAWKAYLRAQAVAEQLAPGADVPRDLARHWAA